MSDTINATFSECPACRSSVIHAEDLALVSCACGHEFRVKPTPFAEDRALTEQAERLGLQLERWQSIRITDRKALEAAGLMTTEPDYARIRKLLKDGASVAGAELGEYEYKLRRIR